MSSGSTTRPGAPPAWDSSSGGSLPGALVTVALLALLPAVTSTLLRVFPPVADTPAMFAAFIPYGLLGYVVALACLLLALVRARRRRLLAGATVVVLALTCVHVSWLAPFFVADPRPQVGPSFTLLTLNVYEGQADVGELATAAATADVVVLEETTPDFLARLRTPAWQARYPYALGVPEQQVSDTTVFSHFPLSGGRFVGSASSQQWVTTVEVPGRSPVRLIAAHPCNPFCGHGQFASDHALLRASVDANLAHPLVVAGDLNAVDDHAPLQQLHHDGMRSATDLLGAGWLPTYPADRAFPPLLPIDHVLVDDDLTATALSRVRISGTDHLGLLCILVGTA